MRETMDSLTSESTILRDFSAFDTSAPINATILFDNDSNEHTDISFKSEYETENDTSHITMIPNRLEIPINSSEEIKETNFDKTIQQNVAKESNTHQIEDLHNEKLKTDDSKKRKQKQLQIYKNKKAAKMSPQINSSNNFCITNNLNKEQSEISTPANEYSMLKSNQYFKIAPQNPPQSKHTAGLSDAPVLLQNNMDSQNRTETCLSSVSEYMRYIISAYYYQRQHQTFKEDYKRIKNKLFEISYNTVVEKLLPEENNTEFIKDFVKATHNRASEKSGYKCFYQDYDMLVKELIKWAKNKTQEQPNLTDQNNDVQLNNSCKSGDMESICIFSSGSPGREISINIDPSLGACREKEGMHQSLKEMLGSNDTPSQSLPPRLPQIRKPLEMQHTQPPPIQSQFGQSTYIPTQYDQSLLVPPPSSQSTKPKTQPRPSQRLQQQHREPPPYSEYVYLQQQLSQHYREPRNGRPQQSQHVQIHHGQLQQVQPQLGQPQHTPQQYSVQSNHVQSQHGPLQHMQRHYSQPVLPQYCHSNDMQQQFVQSQQVPQHYAQPRHLPPQNGQLKIGQSHLVPPQSGTYTRLNVEQSQYVWTHYEHSNHNRPQNGHTKPGPPLIGQLQPVRPPHYQQSHHLLPQIDQSKYFRPQAGQSQPVLPGYNQNDGLKSLLEKPQRLEWHQELNAFNKQGQIQYQNHKSAPRSASTDSGFISPLNFNVSVDQTVGTPDCPKTKERAPVWEPPSDQSQTPSLLITHVTSLNPEVSFIEEGNCVVCKKSTKQMCMGCMKHYYCTYECQLQDWSSHEPYCKMNNNSNS